MHARILGSRRRPSRSHGDDHRHPPRQGGASCPPVPHPAGADPQPWSGPGRPPGRGLSATPSPVLGGTAWRWTGPHNEHLVRDGLYPGLLVFMVCVARDLEHGRLAGASWLVFARAPPPDAPEGAARRGRGGGAGLLAVGSAVGVAPELGGPDVHELTERARRWPAFRSSRRIVVPRPSMPGSAAPPQPLQGDEHALDTSSPADRTAACAGSSGAAVTCANVRGGVPEVVLQPWPGRPGRAGACRRRGTRSRPAREG